MTLHPIIQGAEPGGTRLPKVKIDLSSPWKTFETFKKAILVRDVVAFQACIDPLCEDKDLKATKEDPDLARIALNMAHEKGHTAQLVIPPKFGTDEVMVYEVTTEGQHSSLFTFRQDGDRWLINNVEG